MIFNSFALGRESKAQVNGCLIRTWLLIVAAKA
jgi:hypothetical protein